MDAMTNKIDDQPEIKALRERVLAIRRAWLDACEAPDPDDGTRLDRLHTEYREAGRVLAEARRAARSLTTATEEEDLDAVNSHRRQLGMKPLYMADGWTAKEIADMAEKIRTTGRMANPVSIKRKLMR
jgi:hypothetical protein